MDELFLIPTTPVAMPRGYWLGEANFLSSQLVLIEPSEFEWQRVKAAIDHHDNNSFDMEIVNNLYGKSCLILPHRRYDLLTGEFRSNKHESYLGSTEEVWDPKKILEETKFIHFSDWPYPKPWLKASDKETQDAQPKCHESPSGEDCTGQQIWLDLYKDFSDRRLVSVPRDVPSEVTLH